MSLFKTSPISFEMLDRSETPSRRYEAGETIVSTGDEAKEMFLVRSGRVEIRVGDKAIEEIGAHGIFGEMALIDHSKRSADAVATEPTEIIPVDERLFVVLVQDTPYFALDVMRVLAERLRAMNEKLAE
ncbi:Crp/Fnr family transcriptional regulator [Bauldia sp.]|uniref:Crp/Fnr family transcriptional regulator n=1 Tax=Bauldia sp. TaxID=2575872 RepID=UPI003BAD9CC4